MSERKFRYFFDFIDGQEKWLNSMAKRGLRLQKCNKASYVFDNCEPDEYEYAVEFVGDMAYSKARDYSSYLESMGFRTFTKNINLNYSFGKMKWRPYAKGMGQIATSPGSYNKELIILEKKKDGKPFELHTDTQDKLSAYKTIRRSYAYAVLLIFAFAAITFVPGVSSLSLPLTWALRLIVTILGVLYLIPTVKYSLTINRIKEESQIFE